MLKDICKRMYKGVGEFVDTSVSMLSALLFSKRKIGKELKKSGCKHHDECVILGTGPSLKDDIDNIIKNKVGKVDFYAVNAFSLSDYFTIIKPQNYVFVDNAWFEPIDDYNREKSKKVLGKINEVTWPMNILLPWRFRGTQVDKCITNKLIKLVYFNDTPINGNKKIRHSLYKKQLGMPSAENVINPAICLSIFLGYKSVYVFGADHSWPKNIYVNDDNVLIYLDKQVYKSDMPVWQKNYPIAEELRGMYKCFISHMLLEDYAEYAGCNVRNCTHGSYIDAYPRDYNWVLE